MSALPPVRTYKVVFHEGDSAPAPKAEVVPMTDEELRLGRSLLDAKERGEPVDTLTSEQKKSLEQLIVAKRATILNNFFGKIAQLSQSAAVFSMHLNGNLVERAEKIRDWMTKNKVSLNWELQKQISFKELAQLFCEEGEEEKESESLPEEELPSRLEALLRVVGAKDELFPKEVLLFDLSDSALQELFSSTCLLRNLELLQEILNQHAPRIQEAYFRHELINAAILGPCEIVQMLLSSLRFSSVTNSLLSAETLFHAVMEGKQTRIIRTVLDRGAFDLLSAKKFADFVRTYLKTERGEECGDRCFALCAQYLQLVKEEAAIRNQAADEGIAIVDRPDGSRVVMRHGANSPCVIAGDIHGGVWM